MGFLFDSPQAPQPVAVPQSPAAVDNTAADKQRQEAENAALAESKAAGRRSTIVAGMQIAGDEQESKGMLAAKKRQAARELGG